MYGYVRLPDPQDGTNCRGCGMTHGDCTFVDLGEDPALARCCDTCNHPNPDKA